MLAKFAVACTLFAGSIAQAAVVAERPIAVGDGTMQGAKLKPYSNAWMYSVLPPSCPRRDMGIWSDVMRFRDRDGQHLLERVQGMAYANGMSSVTINRFDPVTLAPVYSELHAPDSKIVKRKFTGTHVETRVIKAPGSTEEITQADLPTAVFDFNGGMYGTLLAAQPLRIGYSGQIPAVGELDNHYALVPFKVVRREAIRAGFAGRIQAWVVEVGGENPMTFWISDHAPYVLRLTFAGPKGTASYDMIG